MVLKLEVKIKKEDKIFTAPYVSARKMRKTMELSSKMEENNFTEKDLDEMVAYMVDIFGNQFTADEFYDGIEANCMLDIVVNCISAVIGELSKEVIHLNEVQKEKN